MAPRGKRKVSDEQKAAMAQGRNESRAVATYLEALDSHKPKRGRKRTPESIDRRLQSIDGQLESASPVKRLSLVQERLDLLKERDALTGAGHHPTEFEDDFVAVAKAYGDRKGISYAAWRELGVPPNVLKRAGISRAAS